MSQDYNTTVLECLSISAQTVHTLSEISKGFPLDKKEQEKEEMFLTINNDIPRCRS